MTLSYQMVIDRIPDEDGGGYVAYYPDLPGCFSDGDTPVAAAENALEALQCWIEVQSDRSAAIPEPGTAQAEYSQRMEAEREEYQRVCNELEKAKDRIRLLEKEQPRGWRAPPPRAFKQVLFG